jgi:hypothetical protein
VGVLMQRSTIILAVIAAVGFVVANQTLPLPPLQVISSDANARFLEIGIHKAVAIDLPRDIKEVLVADAKTLNVVVRTMRRVYIVGAALGNTNVFFYDDSGAQIAALDVCVSDYHRPGNDTPVSAANQALRDLMKMPVLPRSGTEDSNKPEQTIPQKLQREAAGGDEKQYHIGKALLPGPETSPGPPATGFQLLSTTATDPLRVAVGGIKASTGKLSRPLTSTKLPDV